jgi:hypothetical protein
VLAVTTWLPVVAVDPGGTTGICAVRIEAQTLTAGEFWAHEFYSSIEFLAYDQWPELAAPEAVMNTVLSITASYDGRFPLIIEDFSLRRMSRDRDLLSPVRVGERIAERLAGSPLADGIYLVMQTPSEALGTVTDDRLRRWGLYRRGQPHARDALRHAVHFLRKARDSEELRKAAWGL